MKEAPRPVVRPPHGASAVSHPLSIVFVDLAVSGVALEDVERASPRLSPEQIARFNDLIARGHDGARYWRAAHIALRCVLERHAGIAVRCVPFEIEPGGRPRLPRSAVLANPPHFSLSHTGGYALIAVSLFEPAGVDLETPRSVAITPERRRRIALAAQQLAPGDPLHGEGDAMLLQAWVRLEAAAKATGEGIGRLLTKAGAIGIGRTNPSGAAPLPTESLRVNANVNLAVPVVVRDLALGDGLYGAVAASALPALVAVELLPGDAAGLAAYLAGD